MIKYHLFSLGLEEDDACGSFEASFLTTGLAEILFFSFGSTLTFLLFGWSLVAVALALLFVDFSSR